MAIDPISRRVDLTPFRPLELTPWRPVARGVGGRSAAGVRGGEGIETVTLTRVEVTRARRFEGHGFEADWTFDDRPLPGVRPVQEARAEQKLAEPHEAHHEAASGFEHAAMTPLHTEGFLSLWERRHRGDHTGPPPRRAAAAFLAHERAPIG